MIQLPTFETDRLVFRRVEPKRDDEFLADLFSDPMTRLGWSGRVILPWGQSTIDEIHDKLKNSAIHVLVCLKRAESEQVGGLAHEERSVAGATGRDRGRTGSSTKDPQPIGWLRLGESPLSQCRKADFGVAIHKDFQGKGYAREAIEWMLERAFVGFGFHRVEGAFFSWNEPARKCYRALGFVEEGCRRESFWQQGAWYDEIEIGILAREWKARHGSDLDIQR
ncbi:hypothetical protein JCM10212_001990 [Sporobolomyces blumeae]